MLPNDSHFFCMFDWLQKSSIHKVFRKKDSMFWQFILTIQYIRLRSSLTATLLWKNNGSFSFMPYAKLGCFLRAIYDSHIRIHKNYTTNVVSDFKMVKLFLMPPNMLLEQQISFRWTELWQHHVWKLRKKKNISPIFVRKNKRKLLLL